MQTPKPVFQHAVSKLKQVNAPFMGSILIGVTRLSAFREAEYFYNHEEYAEADDQSTDE